MVRTESVWTSLGRARTREQLHGAGPLSDLPPFSTRQRGDAAPRAAGMGAFFDAMETLSEAGRTRLAAYAEGGHHDVALPGFWSEQDVARRVG